MNSILATLQDDQAGNAKLTSTVLSDFALTQKVLRLANSPTYAPYAKNVTTVSRALMVLGSATVAYTAMSMQLLDAFEGLAASKAHAEAELTKAAFSGKLARGLALTGGEAFGEEAAVSTLLYQVSRLLVVIYCPDEWARIQEFLDLGFSEEEAYTQVIGVTPDELREAAMREWGLPHPVIRKALSTPSTPDAMVTTHHEWLACLAGLSTELAAVFTRGEDVGSVQALVEAYAGPLGQDPEELEQLILEMFEAERQSAADQGYSEGVRPAAGKPINSELRLAQALDEVQSVVGAADLTTITQMVLESMMHGLGLVVSVVFFRIPAKNSYEARIGFGKGVQDALAKMVFDGEFVPDVFHIALSQGRPVYLSDIKEPKIAARMPAWHKAVWPAARSVVLLPIRLNDRSIGLLYGNWGAEPCGSGVTAREFECLNAMRNLISKAFEEAAKAPLGAFVLVDGKAPIPSPKSIDSR